MYFYTPYTDGIVIDHRCAVLLERGVLLHSDPGLSQPRKGVGHPVALQPFAFREVQCVEECAGLIVVLILPLLVTVFSHPADSRPSPIQLSIRSRLQ